MPHDSNQERWEEILDSDDSPSRESKVYSILPESYLLHFDKLGRTALDWQFAIIKKPLIRALKQFLHSYDHDSNSFTIEELIRLAYKHGENDILDELLELNDKSVADAIELLKEYGIIDENNKFANARKRRKKYKELQEDKKAPLFIKVLAKEVKPKQHSTKPKKLITKKTVRKAKLHAKLSGGKKAKLTHTGKQTKSSFKLKSAEKMAKKLPKTLKAIKASSNKNLLKAISKHYKKMLIKLLKNTLAHQQHEAAHHHTEEKTHKSEEKVEKVKTTKNEFKSEPKSIGHELHNNHSHHAYHAAQKEAKNRMSALFSAKTQPTQSTQKSKSGRQPSMVRGRG